MGMMRNLDSQTGSIFAIFDEESRAHIDTKFGACFQTEEIILGSK